MRRRSFLKGITAATALFGATSGQPAMRALAQSALDSPFRRLRSAADDRALVILRLFGGNDGLNTIVPFQDDRYYQARGRGTGNDLSIAADTVIPLQGHSSLGFSPGFAPIAELFNEGKVAVVQNVGYPNQNLSHFRSSDIWFSASDAEMVETSGWYGRYLEERYPDYPNVLPEAPYAIELDTSLGLTLVGRRTEMGHTLDDLSFIPELSEPQRVPLTLAGAEERYIRQMERVANRFMTSIADAERRAPVSRVRYPDGSLLARGLARVARLIAAGLGTGVYILNVDGFDTHDGHLRRHAWLLKYCADAILAFQRDLEAFGLDDRVTTMTVSEFGRRVAPNGTGTDHGAAAPMFVIGSGVRGGVIGKDPDLGNLDEVGNLRMAYDFRQIYASVLAQWFDADDADIYPAALPRSFEQLPLFHRRSSSGTATTSAAQPMAITSIAPNPASDAAHVHVEGVASGMSATVRLYTADGRPVLSQDVMPGASLVRLDLAALPSGAYVCELAAGGLRRVARLVVRR